MMHSCIQTPTPPLKRTHADAVPTIAARAAFAGGQGDPVAWGPVNTHNEDLSSCAHPAGGVWLMPAGGVGCELHNNTTLPQQFKALFRKPPEIAPFTPPPDGEKSQLVTQSHAVNRWRGYRVKDCADRGSSSSIPAGNNGAAGQECRLREAGRGQGGGGAKASGTGGSECGATERCAPGCQIRQVHTRVKGALSRSGTGGFRFKPQT